MYGRVTAESLCPVRLRKSGILCFIDPSCYPVDLAKTMKDIDPRFPKFLRGLLDNVNKIDSHVEF
jgi:hypothetical protein